MFIITLAIANGFCSDIIHRIETTNSISDRIVACRNAGIGSLINFDILPTLIVDQGFPTRRRCNENILIPCPFSHLFAYNHTAPKISWKRTRLHYRKHLDSLLNICGRNLLHVAATKLLRYKRAVKYNTTAVHIRNGDKLKTESHFLIGKTDNANWWFQFLRHRIVGKLVIYSDTCKIAHEVARPWKGEVHCAQKRVWPQAQTCEDSMSFLNEVRSMADAELFIGSMNSNIGRLVAKLRNYSNVVAIDIAKGVNGGRKMFYPF